MTDEKQLLNSIVELAAKVAQKHKTGSAIETYEIDLLWDLGNLLQAYQNGRSTDVIFGSIKNELRIQRRKFDIRLYRGALAIFSYWQNKQDYLRVIKSLNSWGKLREVVPLLEVVLRSEAKINRQDISALIDGANSKTYEEVRELAKKLRLKGDPIFENLGIDIHELEDTLYGVSENLRLRLEENNAEFTNSFRKDFNEYILSIRKCLSVFQNEDTYQTYKKDIQDFAKQAPITASTDELKTLSKLVFDIAKLAISEAARKRAREEIGQKPFGDLSTYLKALSSEDNRKRFLKNQEILNTFLGSMQS